MVIPTLSGGRTIEKALCSTLSDSAIGEVVICVNGDVAYLELCKKLSAKYPDSNIRVFLNGKTTSPMPDNWSYACTLATLPYVRILCDDDEILEGSTSHLLEILEKSRNISFVAGRRRVVSANGSTLIKAIGYRGQRKIFTAEQALKSCALAGTTIFGEPSAILFRREHLIRSMPWTSKHPYVIDLDMCLKILTSRKSAGAVTTEVVSTFQVHNDSLSTNLSKIQSKDFTSLLSEYSGYLYPFSFMWLIVARVKSLVRMYGRKMFYLTLKRSKIGRLINN